MLIEHRHRAIVRIVLALDQRRDINQKRRDRLVASHMVIRTPRVLSWFGCVWAKRTKFSRQFRKTAARFTSAGGGDPEAGAAANLLVPAEREANGPADLTFERAGILKSRAPIIGRTAAAGLESGRRCLGRCPLVHHRIATPSIARRNSLSWINPTAAVCGAGKQSGQPFPRPDEC